MVKSSSRKEKKHNGVNKFKGVRMRKWGKSVAEVRKPNSHDRIWLGSYSTAEEAARAYDVALRCLRGPNVVLNFPGDPPDVQCPEEMTRVQIQVASSRHTHKRGNLVVEEEKVKEEEGMFGDGGGMGSECFLSCDGDIGGGGGGDIGVCMGSEVGVFEPLDMWSF